jgi:outer membrane protein TolC
MNAKIFLKFSLAVVLVTMPADRTLRGSPSDSLGLPELMHLALEKNAEIQSQSAAERIARLRLQQSWSLILPQLDAEGIYTQSSGQDETPDFVAANGLKEKVAWLSLQQTIFNPELIQSITESRIERDKQTTLNHQTRQEILLEIVEAYFAALKARDVMTAYSENVKAFDLLYQQSLILEQNGSVPELDVKKARVEYLLQQNSLTGAHIEYQTTLNHLKGLIGRSASDSLALADFTGPPLHLDSLAIYTEQALANRTELGLLRLESRMALSRRHAALLSHLPTAGAGAYYGWDTNEPLRRDNLAWQFYVDLRLPLWHWGRSIQDYKVADLTYYQNELALEKTRHDIVQEVVQTYSSASGQQNLLQAMKESKEVAAETVRLSKLGYQEGSVTQLEIVNAQNLLTEANLQYLNVLYDLWVAKARLYRAMGKLEENLKWLD